MGRQAKTTKTRGGTAAAPSDVRTARSGRTAVSKGRQADRSAEAPAAGRRRQMTVDDIAQSVGRSGSAPAELPQASVLASLWDWLIQTPFGRLIFGILIAALLLGALLLAVGNRFDRFYLALGLLVLLAAVIRWIFFIRHDAMRQAARPGPDDELPFNIVNKK